MCGAEAEPVMPRRRRSPFRIEFELPAGDLWVFGYGSLMWSPGFRFREAAAATLHGYHRAFCVLSHHYRGTKERPGLVLGLDAGGACKGRAFRVAPADRDRTVRYLMDREMISGVYRPKLHGVRLADGRQVLALTFVANRAHAQYAGKLSAGRIAAIIAMASGVNGANSVYLENTVRHLDELGIVEGPLHRIAERVARIGLAKRRE